MPKFFSQHFRNLQLLSTGAIGIALLLPVHADEVATRSGLEPADQSKVTRVLARERLRANSSTSAAGKGSAGAKPGQSKDCTTNIGTVDTKESRPGVRGPRENITVIKAPVVNKC